MSRLIETIKVESGSLRNLSYHNQRMNLVRKNLWQIAAPIHLEEHIRLPENLGSDLYKCRVLYGRNIEDIAFEPYQLKSVETLKIVIDNAINYRYKWEDRSAIQKLLDKKDGCDDVLIVKGGYFTDTSYANVAFYDGKKWLTPIKPLLGGTQRQKLLDELIIEEAEIKPSDLTRFQKATLFNALMEFNPERSISIEKIV